MEICKNCVNWLEIKPGFATCDFDYFEEKLDKALIFVPQLFECTHFEDIKSIKE